MVLQLTMKRDEKRPKWWYEETDPAGVDYSSAELVQRYDDRHQKLRDYEKNSEIILNRLGLDTDSTVINLGGCPTKITAIAAKKYTHQQTNNQTTKDPKYENLTRSTTNNPN